VGLVEMRDDVFFFAARWKRRDCGRVELVFREKVGEFTTEGAVRERAERTEVDREASPRIDRGARRFVRAKSNEALLERASSERTIHLEDHLESVRIEKESRGGKPAPKPDERRQGGVNGPLESYLHG